MAYDTLVVGGGINALTAACYLAKGTQKVAIVCPEDEILGVCASHEFHPGFKSPGILNDTSMYRSWIYKSLKLKHHGLKAAKDRKVLAMGEKDSFMLSRYLDVICENIESISTKDAKAMRELKTFYKKIKKPIRAFINSMPINAVDPGAGDLWSLLKRGYQLRQLGKQDMLEIMRLAPMAVRDWLEEWFEHDVVRSALALPAVTESYSAPWGAGTNANLLIHEMSRKSGFIGEGQALAQALLKAAQHYGVQFENQSSVKSIEPGKGVTLSNGQQLEAQTIMAACSVKKVFLEYLDRNALSHQFEQNIRHFRSRGLCSQLLLALDQTVPWPGLEDAKNIIIANDLDYIEKAFDPIKYGELPDQPALEVYYPSNELNLAPQGKAVISVLVHYTPYDLKEGWNETSKAKLTQKVLSILDQKCPDLSKHILGSELLSPQDIEARYGLSGGHIYEGEHSLDQLLVRPSPECCQYKTPYEGLYLCSGGTFPGGGLTGVPGALAARKVLSDAS